MSGKELFHTDGPIFGLLDKIGQMILLSLVWFVGCLPLVTVTTSTAALYYTVIKSIRREYGTPMQEFWASYKANLRRGIPITLIMAVLMWLLYCNISLLCQQEQSDRLLLWGSILVLALLAGIAVYICPVLSRFSMGAWSAVRLAFVMAIRYWYITLALILGTAALVALQFYVLPMATVLVLPSAWCFCITYPMEKVLRRYMPPKEDNDDSWYYQ